MSLYQALAQPATPTESGLHAGHAAIVTLVIIAKQVQETMQGQHAKLGLQRMTCGPGLASGDTRRDRNIAKISGFFRRKRQDVGGDVRSPVLAVQAPYPTIRDDGDRDGPACAGRCDSAQPDG